ncbi:MAG: DUF3015 domain-containing protein [Oligoflexia bacterium]|nr:DUF3015 domain-containing protein [Oligoflexia bacterium]
MKKCLVLLGLFLGLISTNLYAADSSSGCGLGWAVFKKNSLVSSSLRATTNAFFLNTIAMTFGTSGCAKHSIVKNEAKQLHFSETNYPQLVAQMSQGQGEYVNSMAGLMGCDSAVFSQTMQQNFSQVVPSADSAKELVQNMQLQVLTNESLARSCGII